MKEEDTERVGRNNDTQLQRKTLYYTDLERDRKIKKYSKMTKDSHKREKGKAE